MALSNGFDTDVSPQDGMSAAQARVRDGEQRFARLGVKHFESPANWADEVVYQVMVDRFNDGDPSNNHSNIEEFQRNNESSTQRGLNTYRHGGDIKGITKRLDYLQRLGITSLWITPILKSNGAYHGYCTQDLANIDEGFGTREDFQDLVQQAHRRGIRVILDVVVNHMCDNNTHYDNERTPFDLNFYRLCLQDLDHKEWLGTPTEARGQRDLVFGSTFFRPLANRHYYSRCGYKKGDATSSGASAVFGDFSDQMFDYNTMNWDFQKIFTEFYKAWIAEADVDGFRLDAAKHVTPDFVARFSTSVRDYARSLGKNNFFVIGEVADNTSVQANYLGKMKLHYPREENQVPFVTRNVLPEIQKTFETHSAFPYPGLNAVYDFTHSGALENVFLGRRSLRSLKNYFWNGDESAASIPGPEFGSLLANRGSSYNMNWNLIEIHDWTRFLTFSKDEYRFRTALGYLLTTEGVPIIYYGMEQGLDGECHFDGTSVHDGETRSQLDGVCRSTEFSNDSRYRQDMFAGGPWRLGSIVPEIDRLAGIGIGTRAPGDGDPFARTDHWLFKYVRKLIAVRKSCSALSHGTIYFRAAHDSSEGLLAYSRIADGREALVVVNSSINDLNISELLVDGSLQGGHLGTRFTNLLNLGEKGELYRNSNGTVLLSFEKANSGRPFIAKSRSVAIFVPESDVREWNNDLEVGLCK